MWKRVVLWIILSVVSLSPSRVSLGAGFQKISLLPILDGIGVNDGDFQGVPLHCASDVTAGLRGENKNKMQWVGHRSYPIAEFTGSPGYEYFALRIHKRSLDQGAKANERAIITGKVVGGKKVEPLTHFFSESGASPSGIRFIDNEWLMVTWLLEDSDGDLVRDIELINVRTGKRRDLKRELKSRGEKCVSMRAYGTEIILTKWEDTVHGTFSFWFYQLKGDRTLKRLGGFDGLALTFDDVAVQLFHNVTDERDVAPFPGGVTIDFNSLRNDEWQRMALTVTEKEGIQLKRLLDDYSRAPKAIVGQRGWASRHLNGRVVHVQNEEGRTQRTFSIKQDALYGPLTRVDGGYLTQMANHPYYGFLYLKDGGRVEDLTPQKENIVHSNVYRDGVIGVSDFNEHNSVDLLIVPLAE